MAKAMSRSAFPKCIRERDFSLIKSFYSFLQYQHGSQIDASLPALAEDEFNLLQSFNSLKDFTDYFYDVYVRDWTGVQQELTQEQRDAEYDKALTCVQRDRDFDRDFDIESECIKDRTSRAARRTKSWFALKKAFHTEKILEAREAKDTRERNKKVKTVYESILRNSPNISEEDAMKEAQKQVPFKQSISFSRAQIFQATFEDKKEGITEDVYLIRPCKKQTGKSAAKKHSAVKKYGSYNKKLQEIRKKRSETDGISRKEAKRLCNIENAKATLTPANTEANTEDAVRPVTQVYTNHSLRTLISHSFFPETFSELKATAINITFVTEPIKRQFV